MGVTTQTSGFCPQELCKGVTSSIRQLMAKTTDSVHSVILLFVYVFGASLYLIN